MSATFDLIVIGGGPGGYVCALRAAHNGLKTAIIDKEKLLGGTCLNWGCIPSKTLLYATELYDKVKHHGAEFGLEGASLKIKFSELQKKRKTVLTSLGEGVEGLMKKNKIARYTGTGKVEGNGKVSIDGKETIEGKAIVLATGSEPISLPFLPIDEKQIVTSTGALELKAPPKSMAVIGGGVIGMEMASVYQRLGTKITVVEMLPQICPFLDHDIGKALHRSFEKKGMEFHLETKVTDCKKGKGDIALTLEKGEKKSTLKTEVVLVSIGRRPYSQGLGLDAVGIHPDPKGFIPVNGTFETSCKGIYALGDLIDGSMLAHRASEEGITFADHLAGKHCKFSYITVPNIIYTHPEVASVGLTETEAKEMGFNVKVGKALYAGNSRARCMGEGEGMAKVLTCGKTGTLLGVHLICPWASELIAEGALALKLKAKTEDLAETCHGHPTLSETIHEAALASISKAVHS